MNILECVLATPAIPAARWVPYERILDHAESVARLERICVEALWTSNLRVFWPSLALLAYGRVEVPTYLPAGDLGQVVRAFARAIEKQRGPVTTDEAARRLGVTARHIRRLIAAGWIKAVLTDSGHWQIDGKSVEELYSTWKR